LLVAVDTARDTGEFSLRREYPMRPKPATMRIRAAMETTRDSVRFDRYFFMAVPFLLARPLTDQQLYTLPR
jgi:hypothetical protein